MKMQVMLQIPFVNVSVVYSFNFSLILDINCQLLIVNILHITPTLLSGITVNILKSINK